MKRRVKVNLHWLVDLPNFQKAGQRFTLPARFEHQNENWTTDAWSITIVTDRSVDTQGRQLATASFLMDDAPQEWLSVGRRFTLSDGRIDVADALIESTS